MLKSIHVPLLSLVLVLLPFPSLAGELLRVPHAYPTIQAAIDTARAGDTVLVADGRYLERIDFKGKNITLGSLFLTTGDPAHIAATVLDAQKQGPVVVFSGGETRGCQLVGLTLTGGLSSCGGGVECRNAGPTLSNLLVVGNAGAGGG